MILSSKPGSANAKILQNKNWKIIKVQKTRNLAIKDFLEYIFSIHFSIIWFN